MNRFQKQFGFIRMHATIVSFFRLRGQMTRAEAATMMNRTAITVTIMYLVDKYYPSLLYIFPNIIETICQLYRALVGYD